MPGTAHPFITREQIDFDKPVGIIVKPESSEATLFASEIKEWLGMRGIKAILEEINEDMGLIIVLGGDGTLLHVAEKAAQQSIAVLGINLGSLGFLTEVNKTDTYSRLEELLNDPVRIEHRLMIRARIVQNGNPSDYRFALNEVVISKNALDRLLRLSTSFNERPLIEHNADGLIFSTPTGATAYNLSAGGPLVYPSLATILVTPICPFMLSSRPIILPANKLISTVFKARNNKETAQILVDGTVHWTMYDGDALEIEAAGHSLKLIVSKNYDYFSILRNKLYWGSQTI